MPLRVRRAARLCDAMLLDIMIARRVPRAKIRHALHACYAALRRKMVDATPLCCRAYAAMFAPCLRADSACADAAWLRYEREAAAPPCHAYLIRHAVDAAACCALFSLSRHAYCAYAMPLCARRLIIAAAFSSRRHAALLRAATMMIECCSR